MLWKECFMTSLLMVSSLAAAAGCGGDGDRVTTSEETAPEAATAESGTEAQQAPPAADARSVTFEAILERWQLPTRLRPYTTVEEAGPNITWTDRDGLPLSYDGPAADVAVVGHASAVTDPVGLSFAGTGDAGPEVADGGKAQASVVSVQIVVDEVLGTAGGPTRAIAPGDSLAVRILVPPGTDGEAMAGELLAFRQLVMVLQAVEAWEADPGTSTWAPLEDGAFVGVVAEDGAVSFPGIGDWLVPTGLTLDDLREAYATPESRVAPPEVIGAFPPG